MFEVLYICFASESQATTDADVFRTFYQCYPQSIIPCQYCQTEHVVSLSDIFCHQVMIPTVDKIQQAINRLIVPPTASRRVSFACCCPFT